jgi:hypothetical protein
MHRLLPRGSPEPAPPPRAGAQPGDDGPQCGGLACGDPLGGDGIGKRGVELVHVALCPICPIAFVIEALSQVRNRRPQLLDSANQGLCRRGDNGGDSSMTSPAT